MITPSPAGGWPKKRAGAKWHSQPAQQENSNVSELQYWRHGGKHPIVSNRIRLIGIFGFHRRRKWQQPFTTSVYRIERRELRAVR